MTIILAILDFLWRIIPVVAGAIFIVAVIGYGAIWLNRWFSVLKNLEPVAADGWKELSATVKQILARLNRVDERLDKVDSRLDKVDSRLDKVDSRFDKVDSRFDKVDSRLDKVDSRFDKMGDDISDLKSDVRVLNNRVGNVEAKVDKLDGGNGKVNAEKKLGNGKRVVNPDLALRNSPLILSDKGKDIVKTLDIESLAEKYHKKVPLQKDMSAYAIEEACFNFASYKLPSLLPKADLQKIENYFYENNFYKHEVYNPVFGILLRDRVFEKRGIPVPKPRSVSTTIARRKSRSAKKSKKK